MEFGRSGEALNKRSAGQTVIATTIDGEVARTAERIGEATALALSASLYAASEQIKGRAPRGAKTCSPVSPQKSSAAGACVHPGGGNLVSTYGSSRSVIARRRSESRSSPSVTSRKTALR